MTTYCSFFVCRGVTTLIVLLEVRRKIMNTIQGTPLAAFLLELMKDALPIKLASRERNTLSQVQLQQRRDGLSRWTEAVLRDKGKLYAGLTSQVGVSIHYDEVSQSNVIIVGCALVVMPVYMDVYVVGNEFFCVWTLGQWRMCFSSRPNIDLRKVPSQREIVGFPQFVRWGMETSILVGDSSSNSEKLPTWFSEESKKGLENLGIGKIIFREEYQSTRESKIQNTSRLLVPPWDRIYVFYREHFIGEVHFE